MNTFNEQVKTLAARIMAESRRKNGKPLLNRRTAIRMAAESCAEPRVIDPCCCITFGGVRWSIPISAPYRPGDRVLCLPGRQAGALWILDPKESAPDIFIKQVAQERHDAYGFTLDRPVFGDACGRHPSPAPIQEATAGAPATHSRPDRQSFGRAAPFPYLSEVEATLLIPAARLGHFRLIPGDGWGDAEIEARVLPNLGYWGIGYWALAMSAYHPASQQTTEAPPTCPATCPYISIPRCPGWLSPQQCPERPAHAVSSPTEQTQIVMPRSTRPAQHQSTGGKSNCGRCCRACLLMDES